MSEKVAKKSEKSNSTKQNEEGLKGRSHFPASSSSYMLMRTLQETIGNRSLNQFLKPENEQDKQDSIRGGVKDVLSSSGHPLDHNTRSFMESQFDYDFSNVRVHTDKKSSQSAEQVNASAYTLGNSIVFAKDRYQPTSQIGRRLIAHELAHVIQQRNNAIISTYLNHLNIQAPDHYMEQNAQEAAIKAESGNLIFNDFSNSYNPLAIISNFDNQSGTFIQRELAVHLPYKHPKIDDHVREEMKNDLEFIRKNIRGQIFGLLPPSPQMQIGIVRRIMKWDRKDEYLPYSDRDKKPFLNNFLYLLNTTGVETRRIISPFKREGLIFDWLFIKLEGEELAQYKELVAQSRFANQMVPEHLSENFWKYMLKNELIGVWGILKGMGVSAASMVDIGSWGVTKALRVAGIDVADPIKVSEWLSTQYDISGKALFGEDWSEGEKLLLGLTAAEIGTKGGEVLWTLTMMGAGSGGAKWSKFGEGKAIKELLQTPKYVKGILTLLGVVGSLKGVEDSLDNIGDIIIKMKEKEKGNFSITQLLTNRDFLKECTVLTANIFTIVKTGKNISGMQEKTKAQFDSIGTLLGITVDTTKVAAQVSELVEISTDESMDEKAREKASGLIIIDILATGYTNVPDVVEGVKALKAKYQTTKDASKESKKVTNITEETSAQKESKKNQPLEGYGEVTFEKQLTESSGLELEEETGIPKVQPTKIIGGVELEAPSAKKSGLSVVRSKKEREKWSKKKPKYEFGEPSGEISGTQYRAGMHYHELNAAEIERGLDIKYDKKAGRPIKVTYRHDEDVLEEKTVSSRDFKKDVSTEGAQPVSSDFKKSGKVRGHLAPLEAVKGSEDAESAINQFTNIVPMEDKINKPGGIWWKAEKRTKDYAKAHKSVIVEIWPIYDKNPKTIGKNKVPIPIEFRRRVSTLDGKVLEDFNYQND